jgi:hypothetical protein
VKRKMTEIPEPKDRLDAATASAVVVSGPEGDAERWRQVDWRRAEADVRRLRQRIFTASKAATNPERLGAVADRHPHDDHDRQAGDRHIGPG